MTYEVIILGHLHMPLYFIGTFTEYSFLLTPFGFSFGDPAGIRTQDPNIKSVVLYRLSY